MQKRFNRLPHRCGESRHRTFIIGAASVMEFFSTLTHALHRRFRRG